MSSLAAAPLLFQVAPDLRAAALENGKTAIVKTTHGQLQGVAENGVLSFKGVPYAGPSDGANRFQAPSKLQPWTGVRDAVAYGARAMQFGGGGANGGPMNENCQFLNIWTPSVEGGAKRPIMFYLHGGGFASGSGGAGKNLDHDGSALCRNNDVVVVTSNHRLGLLGYLYLGGISDEFAASGIAGMLDIVASVRWMRDNASAFGGDPGNIMVWGESGGGEKMYTLLAMPSGNGLYQKASIESAPNLNSGYRDKANETTRLVLADLALNPSQVRDLTNLPVARLVQAWQTVAKKTDGRAGTVGWFGPVVDGNYLPAHPCDPVAPAASKNIPLIVGSNMQESIFQLRSYPEVFTMDEAALRDRMAKRFGARSGRMLEVYQTARPGQSPADIYVAITTHQWMWIDSVTRLERHVALKGAPVYTYLFDYESEVHASDKIAYPAKARHAMEIPFKFDHPENDPMTGQRPERFQAAKNMSRARAAFARTGNPSHPDIPKWPAYTIEQRATMILDAKSRVVNDPMRDERLVWQEFRDNVGARPD